MPKNKKSYSTSRSFFFLLYCEWSDIDNIINSLTSLSSRYAYIIHNKDTYENDVINNESGEVEHNKGDLKKPHIHFYAYLPSRRSVQSVVDYCKSMNFTNRFVQDKCDERACVRYLSHIDYKDKYQYDINNIITNDSYWLKNIYEDELHIDLQQYELYKYIDEFEGYLDLKVLYKYAFDNKYLKAFNKYNYQFNNLLRSHNSAYITARDSAIVEQERVKIANQNYLMRTGADTFGMMTIKGDNDEEYIIAKKDKKKKKQ